MAESTIQQIRNDYPAVTPIDPDKLLIVDQQIDQIVGKQSTVATLSELIATGGRTVTTAAAYETLYADSVVNVSASSITITVGSAMRNGSRLLIRRTSAYDGNPVTISPPSGATFEGRASLELYGQYSFVELERISATVFAIKDREDKYNIIPELRFGGASVGIVYSIQTGSVAIKGNTCSVGGTIRTTSKGTSVGMMTVRFTGAPPSPPDQTAVASLDLTEVVYSGQYAGYMAGDTIYFSNTNLSGVNLGLTNVNANNSSTYRASVTYAI